MKKYIIGLVCGVAIAVGGSVFAGTTGWMAITTTPSLLTPTEQIARGNVYNQYTGEKLIVEITPLEKRLQSLERRIEKLENNNK